MAPNATGIHEMDHQRIMVSQPLLYCVQCKCMHLAICACSKAELRWLAHMCAGAVSVCILPRARPAEAQGCISLQAVAGIVYKQWVGCQYMHNVTLYWTPMHKMWMGLAIDWFTYRKNFFVCFSGFKSELKESFETVRECRLKSTRRESSEIYIFAKSYTPIGWSLPALYMYFILWRLHGEVVKPGNGNGDGNGNGNGNGDGYVQHERQLARPWPLHDPRCRSMTVQSVAYTIATLKPWVARYSTAELPCYLRSLLQPASTLLYVQSQLCHTPPKYLLHPIQHQPSDRVSLVPIYSQLGL